MLGLRYEQSAVNFTKLANHSQPDCSGWPENQHVLYQMGQLCLAAAFLAPHTFRYHWPAFRGSLAAGGLFLALWAGLQACRPDVLGWQLAFLLIHIIHLMAFSIRSFPITFTPDLEQLYLRYFAPHHLSRSDFRELIRSATTLELVSGDVYATEGVTTAGDRLAVLLDGRLKITYEQTFLHYIEPQSFVDSPEFEASENESKEGRYYQVTISASEESCVLVWQAKTLKALLKTRRFYRALLDNILGRDIAHKLYQVQELLGSNTSRRIRRPTDRSLVNDMRTKLSRSLSNNYLEQASLDSEGSDCRSFPGTPIGPYSPSQVSFETCV